MGSERSTRRPTTTPLWGIAFGLLATIGVSLAAAATNSAFFWTVAGISAICTLAPSLALGRRLFGPRHADD